MSKKPLVILGASALVVLLVGGLIYFLAPRLGDLSTFSASPQGSSRLPADTVQAKVIQIIEEGEITLGDNNPQTYQILLVQLLDGQYAGLLDRVPWKLERCLLVERAGAKRARPSPKPGGVTGRNPVPGLAR